VHYSIGPVNSPRQTADVGDFALNHLEALDQLEVARGEVVVDQDIEAIAPQSMSRVAPNIARTAHYKNRH
jgi:hypothetical protein